MSCYRPALIHRYPDPDTGELMSKYIGGRLIRNKLNIDRLESYVGDDIGVISVQDGFLQPVACKKCIGCRLDYSRHWADRLMIEFDHWQRGLFLTLTIDDEHLDILSSGFATTHIASDVSSFNKRLRSWLDYHDQESFRFFATSEYGSASLRPHYHGIYFNLDVYTFPDIKLYRLSKHKKPIYTSETLDKLWKLGKVFIGAVSWQSCAYVARYNLKSLGHDSLVDFGCEKERMLSSRRPGIGGFLFDDHPDLISDFVNHGIDTVYFKDPDGIRPVTSCRYPDFVFHKLDILVPGVYSDYMVNRTKLADDRVLLELSKTDLDEFTYFDKKAQSLNDKIQILHNREFGSLL